MEVRGQFSAREERAKAALKKMWEGVGKSPTPTFGRAQDIRIAEAAYKGHAAERVQPDGSRAQVLHGYIPHLAGGGGAASEGPWPESSPGPTRYSAHLESSQMEGICHLPVSITALFPNDGNSGGRTTWGRSRSVLGSEDLCTPAP